MIKDTFAGIIFAISAYFFGINELIFLAIICFLALAPDTDIPLNEFWRISIKKEKVFSFNTILDEFSYTHKFLFHKPLVVIPLCYVLGFILKNHILALFFALPPSYHFVHDTIDNNFDGVQWFWPFNKLSYKIRFRGGVRMERKNKLQLAQKAAAKASQRKRRSGKILKDNL